jgi:hypothetical protein
MIKAYDSVGFVSVSYRTCVAVAVTYLFSFAYCAAVRVRETPPRSTPMQCTKGLAILFGKFGSQLMRTGSSETRRGLILQL